MSESNGRRKTLGYERFHALTEAIRKNRKEWAAAGMKKDEVLAKLSEAVGFPINSGHLASAVVVMKVPPFWRSSGRETSVRSDRTRRMGRVVLAVVDAIHEFASRCGERFDPAGTIDVAWLREMVRGHGADRPADGVVSEQ